MTGPAFRGALPLAGVVGWPVAHSLSPAMMTRWLDAADRPGTYAAFPVKPEDAARVFATLSKLGIAGVNVTAPHKRDALAAADSASCAARRLGAANLLIAGESGLFADNTDLVGVSAAIRLGRPDGLDGPAVLIGAGGAAGAALAAFSDLGAPEIRIVNRTPENARALARTLQLDAAVYTPDRLGAALDGAVVLVNASAAAPQSPPDLEMTAPGAAVVEMTYAPLRTPWIEAARHAGRIAVDGLEMLVAQARPSFEALFGGPVPAEVDMAGYLRALQRAREG